MAHRKQNGEAAAGSGYNTRQGKLIADYLASLGDLHVTVNDIADHFRRDTGEAVGLATIYRHLEKLVNAGTICKYTPAGGERACYQYHAPDAAREEHFHLRCEKCGKLIHLRCDFLDEISGHVKNEHHFQINPFKTVFYGSCEDCREGIGRQ
jgi:Fur family ferric uptake transcriptional regulator